MTFKVVAGVVAMGLALAFLMPPILKLKDPALAIVIMIGVVLMAIDLWQSIQSKDD